MYCQYKGNLTLEASNLAIGQAIVFEPFIFNLNCAIQVKPALLVININAYQGQGYASNN